MIQLIDAVPLRAFDWAGYELTQHAQHAADVHADRLTTYGSYDVHDNELTGWVHLMLPALRSAACHRRGLFFWEGLHLASSTCGCRGRVAIVASRSLRALSVVAP